MKPSIDETVDGVVANLTELEQPVDAAMMDRVFRPFAHLLVEFETGDEAVTPADVLDSLARIHATMVVELLARAAQKDDTETVVTMVNAYYQTTAAALTSTLSANFPALGYDQGGGYEGTH